jgi:hypothetical protein
LDAGLVRLGVVFFILSPFSTGGEPSADEVNVVVVALDVANDQDTVAIGRADEDKPRLRPRVIRIWNRQG